MSLTVTINRNGDRPVYVQVADQLRTMISQRVLPPGAKLPSVRRLASDLGVNLNTIARAFRLLTEEGFLVIKDRAGTVVSEPAPKIEDATEQRLLEELRSVLARLRQAGLTHADLLGRVEMELDAFGTERVTGSNETNSGELF